MTLAWAKERAAAAAAVRMAARACRAVQDRLVQHGAIAKQDRSPVTVADFASQAIVCRLLGQIFPDDPVVGEENSSALRQPPQAQAQAFVVQHVSCEFNQNLPATQVLEWIDRGATPLEDYRKRHWTIDPIDGTKGFLRGEQYAVALALVEEGRVVVGALGCPHLTVGEENGERGVLLVAVRGQGTQRLPLWEDRNDADQDVRVDGKARAEEARFCESVESVHSRQDVSAHLARELGITAQPLRMDSQAKYAAVALGQASFYLKFPPDPRREENIWDHAAGSIVVEEAGGRVTDMAGRPLDFGRGRGLRIERGIVASNAHVHEQLLETIARL